MIDDFFKKVKVRRGTKALEKVIKYPNEKEFFTSLGPDNILFKMFKPINKYNSILCLFKENDKYGYFFREWCGCKACAQPFVAANATDLRRKMNNCLQQIVWFDSLEGLKLSFEHFPEEIKQEIINFKLS